MPLPHDYAERVYAGVLGKLIGVYLGRPFEGWWYDKIMQDLGEIWYYVHERLDKPLIVTDDDISGTFTFLRAMPDYGNSLNLTSAQIGATWMNYIVEKRSILWWGGMGMSTEHTAYLRMKNGILPPASGSIATNGKVVAEQIGSQIFIDGWGMICPNEPALAADLAQRAASVSHDGEAIYGAQVVAAMEAAAFSESDINALIDCGVSFIPNNSIIYRMINDIREWHAEFPDWHHTREQIVANYGYDKYGGNCHMIPNHALIIMSVLYAPDDFQKALMMANTAGWDTDCNSGNVGCILGIKNGLAGIENGPDWRTPVADRLYLPTADGGRAVTDAVTETYHVVNIAKAIWEPGSEPVKPKNGARFHFSLPGSVQGWMAEDPRLLDVSNLSRYGAQPRSLHLGFAHLARGTAARAYTATFIPPEAINMPHYGLIASPTLYPGQTIRAYLSADARNDRPVTCKFYIEQYGAGDQLERTYGPAVTLDAQGDYQCEWLLDDIGYEPIARVGVEISVESAIHGAVYLDWLTWDGAPDMTFGKPADPFKDTMALRQWVNGVDHLIPWGDDTFRIAQDEGTGLLITGTREWTDYEVSTTVTPHMVRSAGIAARVQGMKRYYGLLLCNDNMARLVRGDQEVMAEVPFVWAFGETHALKMRVTGSRIQAWIDDEPAFDMTDESPLAFTGGGIGLVVEEGRTAMGEVVVKG
jgi:ADP-ribosylglycohydrolase